MPRQKGQPKVGGRKAGTPNKLTAGAKAALTQAFEGVGGVEALVKWGRANRTEFYRLWGRLIPTEIKNADGEKFRVEIVEEVVSAALDSPPDSGHTSSAGASG